MKNQNCGNCLFSDKIADFAMRDNKNLSGVIRSLRVIINSEKVSYCKRNPPTKDIKDDQYDEQAMASFPIVSDDSWCGHYLREDND